MDKLLLLLLAVTGTLSRCGGEPVSLAFPPAPEDGGAGGSVTTTTEDGGEGGAEPTTSSTTTTGTGGEGGTGGEAGGGSGGAGGDGGQGGTGGAGGEGGSAPLGAIGAPCLDYLECESLFCQKGPNAGVCTTPCATTADCPGGDKVCSGGYCYVKCQEGDPQGKCPDAFECVSPGACQPAIW